MAFTSAVIIGGAIGGAVLGNQQKQAQKGQIGALNRSLQASIAATPPPPNPAQQNGQAAAAMTAAAARQRRIAAGAGGFAQNVLTSGQGAPQAPTAHKQLLGI